MLGSSFVILASLCWAFDALIRYPLLGQGYSAVHIVFFEHLILSLLFLPRFKTFSKLLKTKGLTPLISFFIVGCIGSALSTIAYTQAFIILNPSVVILIQKFQPVIAILLARIILGESLKQEFFFWGLVCLIGGFLISYHDFFDSSGNFIVSFSFDGKELGYLLAFFAVAGWGSSTVFGKKLSLHGFDPSSILLGRFSFGFAAICPFLFFTASFPEEGSYYNKIMLMVFISGILGMSLYYQGLKRIPARVCTLLEMSFPLCAVIVNWLFLDQHLNMMQIVGGAVLLFGSTMLQVRSV